MNSMRKTLCVAIGAAAFGVATSATAAQSLTIVSWGGSYTNSQVQAYHKPWVKKTGIKINSVDYNGGMAEVKAQVESGNVTWDAVDVEASDAVRGCDEGLFEEIDASTLPPAPDGTPATEDFIEGTIFPCGIPQIVWSTVVAYDKTKFAGNAPKVIADFFDMKTYPGKRGLRKGPKVNLEWALMADGVPTNKVYEVLGTAAGVDRAFAKLEGIKANTVWWEAGAQPPQLLADGEVAMTSAYNGRLFNAIVKEKKPFVIIWDGQLWDLDLWAIPKGAPNLESVLEFVRFSTDTLRNYDQSNYISYGPVRKSSQAMIKPAMRPHMPTSPENFKNALHNDFEFWADHVDELKERFTTWLAR